MNCSRCNKHADNLAYNSMLNPMCMDCFDWVRFKVTLMLILPLLALLVVGKLKGYL